MLHQPQTYPDPRPAIAADALSGKINVVQFIHRLKALGDSDDSIRAQWMAMRTEEQ